MDTIICLSRLVHSLIVTCAVAWCFSPARGDSQRIHLREVWSTGGVAGRFEFGAVSGMAEAADGSIWVSDGMNGAVARLKADGSGLAVVATTGSRAGQVEGPSLIAPIRANQIAVYDLLHEGLEIFRSDGRYIRHIPLDVLVLNPKGIIALPTGEFVISGGAPDRSGSIHRFTSSGKWVGALGDLSGSEDPRIALLISGGPITRLPNGDVLLSQSAPHQILVFPGGQSSPLTLARDASVVPPIAERFARNEHGKRGFDWSFRQSTGIFQLADGRLLNVVWDDARKGSLWQLYNDEGSLVRQAWVPRGYRVWSQMRNGDILASLRDSATGEVKAVRLRMTVEKVP